LPKKYYSEPDTMDNLSPETVQGLQKLSDKDKQELNQFITQEGRQRYTTLSAISLILFAGQKQQIQATVHSLTDMCFKKSVSMLFPLAMKIANMKNRCVTSKISAGKLDRSEEPCMQNCVDRYMDANMTVIRHLEQMRQLG
jgi:mitochondrial import inner membrane translocase subunit TIM8